MTCIKRRVPTSSKTCDDEGNCIQVYGIRYVGPVRQGDAQNTEHAAVGRVELQALIQRRGPELQAIIQCTIIDEETRACAQTSVQLLHVPQNYCCSANALRYDMPQEHA